VKFHVRRAAQCKSEQGLPAACSEDIGVLIPFHDFDDNTIFEMRVVTSEHQGMEEDLSSDSSCVCELDCLSDCLDRGLHKSCGRWRDLVESRYCIVYFLFYNFI